MEQIDEEVENDIVKKRIIAIVMAIGVGLVGSMRPLQAKYINVKYNYDPTEFSIDSGFVTGGCLFLLWLIFSLNGNQNYTLNNYGFSFLGSILMVCWSLVGLNSMIKGL